MANTLLSVCLITYNQEKFIRNAIESILMQKVNFDWELIIADDCSTDGTREILKEYKEKHPDIIKLILQKKNVGPAKNHIELISTPKSKYIALCDGDDYWTDSLKLQKQVDFLEANQDYVLCFHQIKILKNNGTIVDDFITKVPENYETIDTLAKLGNYIHTPTVVYRNIISEFPLDFKTAPIGDYFLYMLLAKSGKLGYLNESMAVYREGVGIWSKEADYFRNLNTAYTNALLVSSNSFDNHISLLLIDRINSFLKRFKREINVQDLNKINTCAKINESIYSHFLNENSDYNSENVNMKTSKELFKIIFLRIKKRLWK